MTMIGELSISPSSFLPIPTHREWAPKTSRYRPATNPVQTTFTTNNTVRPARSVVTYGTGVMALDVLSDN